MAVILELSLHLSPFQSDFDAALIMRVHAPPFESGFAWVGQVNDVAMVAIRCWAEAARGSASLCSCGTWLPPRENPWLPAGGWEARGEQPSGSSWGHSGPAYKHDRKLWDTSFQWGKSSLQPHGSCTTKSEPSHDQNHLADLQAHVTELWGLLRYVEYIHTYMNKYRNIDG